MRSTFLQGGLSGLRGEAKSRKGRSAATSGEARRTQYWREQAVAKGRESGRAQDSGERRAGAAVESGRLCGAVAEHLRSPRSSEARAWGHGQLVGKHGLVIRRCRRTIGGTSIEVLRRSFTCLDAPCRKLTPAGIRSAGLVFSACPGFVARQTGKE